MRTQPLGPGAGQHLPGESTPCSARENGPGFPDTKLCSGAGQAEGVPDKDTKATQLTWFCSSFTEEKSLAASVHLPANI